MKVAEDLQSSACAGKMISVLPPVKSLLKQSKESWNGEKGLSTYSKSY